MFRVIGFFLVLICFASCIKEDNTIPNAPLVLKGYLYGGEIVDDIYLEKVNTSRDFTQQENLPISNAHITLIGENETVVLSPDPDKPGYYLHESYLIQPNSEYKIEVEYEDQTISSSCEVPDTLSIEAQFSEEILLSSVEESVISFQWESLGPEYEYLISLELDESEEMVPFGLSNGNGKFDDDYGSPIKETAASLIGLDFSFKGTHRVYVYTLSKEYSRYYSYLPSSFSSNIFSAPNNIENGYGVFAGLTGTSFEFTLLE